MGPSYLGLGRRGRRALGPSGPAASLGQALFGDQFGLFTGYWFIQTRYFHLMTWIFCKTVHFIQVSDLFAQSLILLVRLVKFPFCLASPFLVAGWTRPHGPPPSCSPNAHLGTPVLTRLQTLGPFFFDLIS